MSMMGTLSLYQGFSRISLKVLPFHEHESRFYSLVVPGTYFARSLDSVLDSKFTSIPKTTFEIIALPLFPRVPIQHDACYHLSRRLLLGQGAFSFGSDWFFVIFSISRPRRVKTETRLRGSCAEPLTLSQMNWMNTTLQSLSVFPRHPDGMHMLCSNAWHDLKGL